MFGGAGRAAAAAPRGLAHWCGVARLTGSAAAPAGTPSTSTSSAPASSSPASGGSTSRSGALVWRGQADRQRRGTGRHTFDLDQLGTGQQQPGQQRRHLEVWRTGVAWPGRPAAPRHRPSAPEGRHSTSTGSALASGGPASSGGTSRSGALVWRGQADRQRRGRLGARQWRPGQQRQRLEVWRTGVAWPGRPAAPRHRPARPRPRPARRRPAAARPAAATPRGRAHWRGLRGGDVVSSCAQQSPGRVRTRSRRLATAAPQPLSFLRPLRRHRSRAQRTFQPAQPLARGRGPNYPHASGRRKNLWWGGGGAREERRFLLSLLPPLPPICPRLIPRLPPLCPRCCISSLILFYVVDSIGEFRDICPCWAALPPLPPAVRRQIRPVSVLGAPSQNGQMPRADSPAAAFPGGQQHTPTGRPACPDPAHTTRPALPPLSCPDGRSPARGRAGGMHRGQQVGPSAHDSQASTRRKGGPIRRPGTGSPRHLAAACPGSRPMPASSAGAVPRTRFGCTRAPAHRARHGPVVPL